MEETVEKQEQEQVRPKSKWQIHFWPVVIAILLTTILLSSVGFYWQVQSNKKQQALEDYIRYLQTPGNVQVN